MELQSGTIHFHTLHAQTKPIKNYAECTILWLSELKQISTSQTLSKPKTSKKVIKKSLMEKSISDTEVSGKTASVKTTKNNNGQKPVRKKVATTITTVPSTATPITNNDTKTGNDISGNSKKMIISKVRNSLTNDVNSENYTNGDGSADSGISLVDSDTEKSSKCTKKNELAEPESSVGKQTEAMSSNVEFAIPISTSKINLKTNNDGMDNSDSSISITFMKGNIPIYNNDLPPSFTVRRNNIKYEMNKKIERILEEEEKEKSEDWDRCDSIKLTNNGHNVPSDRCINTHDSSIPIRRRTPTHVNSISKTIGFDGLQR